MGYLSRKIKFGLAFCCGLACWAGRAQQTAELDQGVARAVIVGISNYQDESIRDLTYADRDARAFADFLKSKSGEIYGLRETRVFVNEEASLSALQSALQWLVENSKKGDLAIFYFAGHGDVETINEAEKGYLLAYDTPKNNYRLNAIDVQYLNENVLQGLSDKGVKAMAVLDACHAGTLAGDAVGGRESTAAELTKRRSGEIKILACQAYELAQEGSDIGGGRGVFSWYLVDGLRGRADLDNDRRVDLYEIDEFLQRRVRTATQKKQHPEVVGGRKQEVLFVVDDSTKNALKTLEKVEMERDFETVILQKLASQKGFNTYKKFRDCLKNGPLVGEGSKNAVAYYRQLYADTAFIPLRGIMSDRLVRTLLDSAQQAINAYLKTDPAELAQRDRFDQKYARFPEYLRQSAQILGTADPRYRQILAKQYYFEGLVLRIQAEKQNDDENLLLGALEKQKTALQQEARAAYIHNELGVIYLALDSVEEARKSLKSAVSMAPTWAIPQLNLGYAFYEIDSLRAAKRYYNNALMLKPDFSSAFCNLGNLYARIEQPDSAEVMYQKAIELYSEDKDAYYDYGLLLGGISGRESEAEELFKKAIALDSAYADAWFGLGNLYAALEKPVLAENFLKEACRLNPDYTEAWQNLGILYFGQERLEEAEKAFSRAVAADSSFTDAWVSLVFLRRNDWSTARELVKNAPLDTAGKVIVFTFAGSQFAAEGDYTAADRAYRSAVETGPEEPMGYCGKFLNEAAQKRDPEAFKYLRLTLEKAQKKNILNDYYDIITENEDLRAFRKKRQFRETMKNFFPDRF